MNPFDTIAFAQDGGSGGGFPIEIFFIVGLIAVFYFLIWRPQSRQKKAHATLVGGLSKGDEVVTAGGMVGQVMRVEEDFVYVRVAPNVEIRFQKNAMQATLPKGTLKTLDGK